MGGRENLRYQFIKWYWLVFGSILISGLFILRSWIEPTSYSAHLTFPFDGDNANVKGTF